MVDELGKKEFLRCLEMSLNDSVYERQTLVILSWRKPAVWEDIIVFGHEIASYILRSRHLTFFGI